VLFVLPRTLGAVGTKPTVEVNHCAPLDPREWFDQRGALSGAPSRLALGVLFRMGLLVFGHVLVVAFSMGLLIGAAICQISFQVGRSPVASPFRPSLAMGEVIPASRGFPFLTIGIPCPFLDADLLAPTGF